ncbi:glycosyl hydrolase family 95 catalytic domain-containing protein [Gracilibacillus kekensis]|uniref:Glycosyl hydrolase family 65, N-terminal domain n=1 Tax=Gracilibacillus kekensis TaxID=1027249 RepID=A0A1M7N586_9BACI|nr:glycoside hydrolase N-terminal domain-containing protein [Gracilibacillus kekensis]SHM98594.1 Glycosyl hydrolase family 65, N-terminal domain [Gracilibacillus kekensis]
MSYPKPERGIWTDQPASCWEDALVSGNGRHGVLVYGDPIRDVLIGNHCRLYLPQGNSYQLPDLAPFLEEMREIIQKKGYKEAIAYHYVKAKIQGYQGLTMSDPSHPGFHLQIETDHHYFENYHRSINYQTGELVIAYDEKEQSYIRKTFVSQKSNQIFHYLSSGTYKIKIEDYQNQYMSQVVTIYEQTMHIHFDYLYGDGGYDVMIKVTGDGITPLSNRKGFELRSEQAFLISMEIIPYSNPDKRGIIKLDKLKEKSYEALFLEHQVIHQDMFDRVELSLSSDDQRKRSIWELVAEAKGQNRMTPVLLEKMYDAGRYMFICSAGELTPNLQGIWTGTFHPAWSGDFTFDTNVELSIASALSSNLLEGLEGYFRLIKELMPGFRENARFYYGARGVMASIHSSNSGKHVHWNQEWPLHLWTCGAGWLAHWYFQYYRFTGDQLFLEKEVIPFLEEVVLFYQDFLIEDPTGVFRFSPSYSAENGAADNATQDVAVAKEVLSNLIESYQLLNYPKEKICQCEKMLDKMPSYQINEDGALKEWLTPEQEENYNHRHFSHLYPVFQSREFNEETDPIMWKAAKTAFEKRLEAWLLNEEGDTSSTHGRMHSALCATQFHMPDLIEDIFRLLIKNNCFYSSLIMSHYNEQEIFNVDGNGALPQVVHEMIIDYSNDRLTILGALPKSIPYGEIRGVRLSKQITVHKVVWDINKKRISLELESPIQQKMKLYVPLFPQAKHHQQWFSLDQNKRLHLEIEW